ncbi:hypothetical protein [Miltoncostaea marina]|uniref:hypothetical protein n=1 Tax=Miltoncostaea marina TaxID=2843215 RepID=UPI001C3E578D|nr:hypothetical protein [Miltoncostaea marina]
MQGRLAELSTASADDLAGAVAPEVGRSLKFNAALPPRLAREVVAGRMLDIEGARAVAARPLLSTSGEGPLKDA